MSSRNKTDVKKLFEFWCEVKHVHGLGGDQRNSSGRSSSHSVPTGIIVESFPESFRDEKTIADIPAFAFPCEFESESVQTYSFVLTTDDSKWRFGFCRHDPKTDSVMVLITHLPWHDIFLRFLTVLAELRRSNHPDFRLFLAETYNRGVPDPGGHLKIFYNGGENWFTFERPRQFQLPSIPENHNLNLYYNFVDPKNMIAVFAAMLAERRIIFTSRRLDRLSSCIQAANAFLYPMVWQHIFIPVLPMKLKDYLSAPMPYLIGVPETVLETMLPEELGEVVILNCDTKIFESPFDDVHEMPTEIVSQLKKQLNNTHEHTGDSVSRIFLGVLVQLIGGYRDAVEFRDSSKTFNRERFIESRPSNLRPFMGKMMQLQIFQQFIDERLQLLHTGLLYSDEFEVETVRYAEKNKKHRRLVFLKNVKEKTNPAVKSAVKSVKESSRGVKTYYKDLKTKFRDIPPNSSAAHSTHFHSHLSSNTQHEEMDGSGSISNNTLMNRRRSESSSPIDKRGTNGFQYAKSEVLSAAAPYLTRTPTPLETSSSSTHVPISNGHGVRGLSPSVSPASSLASSEMNLSQELQNHPLFKSPIVDRTLKPSHSLDLHDRISAMRVTASTTASSTNLNTSLTRQKPIHSATVAKYRQATATYYNHPYNLQQQTQQQPQQQTQAQVILKQNTLPKIITTASPYDQPPNMLSPPVPPRRQNITNGGMHTVQNSITIAAAAAAVHEGIYRLERNCWQNYANGVNEHSSTSSSNTSSVSSASASILSTSSMTTDSSASFVSAASTFSHISPMQKAQKPTPQNQHAQLSQPPVPAPRLRKDKESLRSLQTQHMSLSQSATHEQHRTRTASEDNIVQDDLITLDDSNNASFDLEDFDPLNQNARPLPTMKQNNNKKATTLPAKTSASQMQQQHQQLADRNRSKNSLQNSVHGHFTLQQNRTTTTNTITSTGSIRPPRPPPPTINIQRPPPLPKSSPPPMPQPDDDIELLRQYGLDQLTWTTATTDTTVTGTLSKTSISQKAMATAGRSNWTTFD